MIATGLAELLGTSATALKPTTPTAAGFDGLLAVVCTNAPTSAEAAPAVPLAVAPRPATASAKPAALPAAPLSRWRPALEPVMDDAPPTATPTVQATPPVRALAEATADAPPPPPAEANPATAVVELLRWLQPAAEAQPKPPPGDQPTPVPSSAARSPALPVARLSAEPSVAAIAPNPPPAEALPPTSSSPSIEALTPISATAPTVPALAAAAFTLPPLPERAASIAAPGPPLALHSAEWSQQLGEHIHWQLDAGVQEARIEVNPRELGPVSVRLSMEESGVRVQLTAAQPATRDLLQGELPRLRELLQQGGIALADAQVGRDAPWREPQRQSAPTSPRGLGDDTDAKVPVTTRRWLRRIGLLDDYA